MSIAGSARTGEDLDRPTIEDPGARLTAEALTEDVRAAIDKLRAAEDEIIEQVLYYARRLDTHGERVTNIVMMGMGEPLANYKNLVDAIAVITDSSFGLGFAGRRVTVSTAGLVSRLADLGRDTRVNLAVSLNATDNTTRSRLMPINRKFPIEKLLEACQHFPLRGGRRITIEYVLLKGVNDSVKDARRLAGLLRPIKSKINLIPFNSHPGCRYQRPDEDTILRFQKILIDKNYTVMIRQSKGQDISAACGQLAVKTEDRGQKTDGSS